MSPTADQSDVRSTRSSSSSKVLAAKFDSLRQEWDDHETDSPIKTVTIGGKSGSNRQSSSKITTSRKDENDNRRGNTKDRSLQTPASNFRDDDSVGSISTLGSTESVFERLYSQRKSSSTKKSHREYESRIPNSSGGSVGSAGKYRTPMSTRLRQSGGTKNRKNRLGAYSNSTALETKSVGYQDSTPRRRTTTRKASHRKDASSVVSALSAESEDDNSVFCRLYRNEKRTEKLWKVPDDGSVSSTPSQRRRTDLAKPSPVFERLHRNERRSEKLWNDPDDGSVASTPVRRSRTTVTKPSPVFDRLYRNETRSEKLWKDPDDGSVASTPVRRTRTAITKPSPVFDRLYRNERRTAMTNSDDASVVSTVSRRSRTDDFDPNPTFVRMRNGKKRPDTRMKSDDSSVCSTSSKSSRTEDYYYDPNSVFTTLYQKPREITRTPPRRKPETKPSPVFDRLYRASPKRPVEKARKKETVVASPQQTPAQHHRREDSNPIYDRLHSNQKRTEKLWKIPKAFVPSPSNKRNHKPKEPPKSGDKAEQSSPFEEQQKYLQEIIEDKHNDEEQLQDQESPFEEEQKYLQEINEDVEHDEEDLQLLDKSANEEHLSGLKILTNDDLEVIDELERLENFYEGCTPTVALTSVSSSNWDESPDTRRQSNEGQPTTAAEINAPIVEKDVDTFGSARSKSTQSDDDEQRSLDFKKTKQKSGDDDTSGDTPTSTTYCVDYGDSYRSFSTGNNYNEEKADRRRTREQIGTVSSPTSKPMLTPRSLRGACAVTIQSAYRLHRAELELASAMIRSWDADIQFQNGNNEMPLPSIYRAPALKQALRGVRCWWILEGLRIEDDWTTLAWENEVCIGDNIRAQVNLSCEAKTVQSIFHWEPTKVATLLAKAILFKATEHERASQNVTSIDELCENATKLQRWFRGRRKGRHVEIEDEHPTETIAFTLSEDEDEEDDANLGVTTSEAGHDSILSSWKNVEEEIIFDDSPTVAPPNEVLPEEEKNAAAIKIQSFFRLAILKSAIRDLPSTAARLESVLETTGPLSKRMDAVVAARSILLTSALNQQSDRSSEIISEEDFISQRAAALAINNIVQTYVTGLRKFREKKRATLIQAVFRGYRTRKRLELEELSAVVIQFAWSERRYIKIKEKSATKIQGLVRMYFRRRSYEMNRFCIVLMQSVFRRAIARRKLALLKSSALSLQSAWRASADRKRYLKFISAIESIQYLWKVRQTITTYQKECQSATTIQVWWRSQSPRKVFLESVKAATLLQSHIRSYLQCRKFRKAQFDSIMIQRSWRSYHWSKRYESQKRSAICLQAFYRRYQSIAIANARRRSSLDIQRVTRGYLERQKIPALVEERRKALFIRERNGAITIQNIWRMSIRRKRYVLLMQSTTLLQCVTRGSIARSLYKRKINSAQTIQSLFRRFIEESRRRKAHLAAIQIQRNWRAALVAKYVASVRLKKSIASTIMIQSAWRSARARHTYDTMQKASIAIQSFYRKRSAEKAMRGLIKDRSIILIQSQWRGAMERENFTIARISAIMIQASVRRMLILESTKKLRIQNSLECHASTIIQAHWRGAMERENFTMARISAIMIQASVRRMLTVKRTKKLRIQNSLECHASTIIQSHWRGAVLRENFTMARISAIMIQASVRRMMTVNRTKKLSSQHTLEQDASTLIQSHWRRAKANEEFEKARVSAMVITLGSKYNEELRNELLSKSSIVIQAYWRGAVAREEFALARGAVIMIQSHARRMLAIQKRQSRKAAKSSVKVQAYWRRRVEQKRFSESREAAIMIQSCTRMMFALRTLRKKEEEKYMRQVTKSSIKIQAWWRVVVERRTFTVARGSAIIIQSYVRMWIALQLTEEAKRKILATKSSVKIQACWRGVMAQETFIISRGSAIMIQASVRMMIARRMKERMRKTRLANKSSTRIQAYWRGSKARHYFDTARGAAIIIQSCGRRAIAMKAKNNMEHQRLATRSSTKIQAYWRGATVRSSVAMAHDSAIIIQTNVRRLKATRTKETISRDSQATDSIIAIQTFWRMAAARDRFTTVCKSTVRIQAVVRGMLARRSNAELNTEKMTSKSSIAIQSKWREYIARSKFHESRSAAIIIQAGLRRMSCSMKVQRLKRHVQCSVVIQSYWRRAIKRDRYARVRFATITIQSFVRRTMARSRLTEMAHSLVLIQKSYRAHIARSEFHRARSAAICIQERFRSYRMKAHSIAISSAIVLQTSWRMTMARSAFLSLKTSTVLVQSTARGYIERERIKQKKAFAVLLQSHWRSSNAREHYVQCRGAIIMIQAMVRGEFARSQFKSNQRSAVCIQRNFRKILVQKRLQNAELWKREATASSILIQAHWRGSIARDKYMQRRVAAMIIQSTIRGARVRSQWGFVRLLSTHKNILNESARKIQLAYIAWKVDIELWELRSLAVLLQRGVRGQLARSAVQYALMQINASRHTAIVNSRARLVVEKVHGASSVCSWNKAISGTRVSAAIIIQSFVRRFLTKNHIRDKLGLEFGRSNATAIPMKKKHNAAVKIQTIFRKQMACKYVRMMISDLNLKSEAATEIQKLHRRRKQEQRFALQKQSILMIQSAWRSKSARLFFGKMKALRNFSLQTKAAVRIQAFQRCRKQHEHFLHQKQAILKIQCLWRKSMAKIVLGEKKALQDFSKKTKAATFLQANQRRLKQERLYFVQKQAILKIQCSWRRKFAQMVYNHKKVSHDLARTKAATAIQTFQRCQQQNQRFLIQKQATMVIQSAWRSKLAHLAFANMKAAQNVATATKAAVSIQAFQRCQKQKQHFLLQKQAILKIQCFLRRILAQTTLANMKKLQDIAVETNAAICIQTFQRRHTQRHNYLLKKEFVIAIQNKGRSFLLRQAFLTKKTAAILIQTKFRRYKCLKKLRNVVKIQSLYRKRMAQRSFRMCKAAARRIQSKYRKHQRQETLRRQREHQRRRMERDFKQALSEMRIASLLTAESLLSKKDTIKNGPFLKALAARVHSTLNEAALLVNEGTREMIRIDPFATDNASSLKELEYRVQRALNEAASLSNEDIWQFISREPLDFPLPSEVEKFDLPTLTQISTKDKGTPVRSNKGLLLSDSFEEIETLDFSPKTTPSLTKPSESKPLKSPGILKSSKHTNDQSSKSTMMSPLADLMREARAARSKNRTDSAPAANLGKTPIKDPKIENATSPKNFGDATMPSPIRPQEESADWDWASEW